jgi:putative oxidoreductase
MKKLLSTTPTLWQLPLRFCLFFVFWMHGSQKVLGLYGGPGLGGFVGWMGSMGVPAPLATLAAFAEFLGAWGMLVGFLTRVAAFGLCCQMAVAILLVHLPNGFFTQSSVPGKGAGYEYPMTLLLMALAILIGGAGRLSLDHAIAGRRSPSA